jgi:hypothetical protein
MPVLAVVGAGPKGIAIAAKARALAAAGLDPPRVVLIEPGAVAGNWGGQQGYTSGLLPLGTPAEKDVGFPYASSWGSASAAVSAAMADYSWQRIQADLSVAGLSPPLHLPVVAGLAQGPGFPNLSCLGLLSDRILGRYVTAAERRERV